MFSVKQSSLDPVNISMKEAWDALLVFGQRPRDILQTRGPELGRVYRRSALEQFRRRKTKLSNRRLRIGNAQIFGDLRLPRRRLPLDLTADSVDGLTDGPRLGRGGGKQQQRRDKTHD